MKNYKIIWLICILITSKVHAQHGNIDSTENLILKQIGENPENRLALLFYNTNVSFADSLIKISARSQPEKLYVFAQAKNTALGVRIHACNDRVVKVIAELTKLDEGQLYFPFLDNLVSGKLTMAEISKTLGEENKINYYKLLVKTQIGYAERLKKKDTIIASNSLMNMLKMQALNQYINVVNELH